MNHDKATHSNAMLQERDGYSWLGLLVSFALVGILVMAGSRAAFTDSTANTGNEIAAGDVVLTDDDAGAVLFQLANLAPGDGDTNCIAVTYGGSISDPGAVRLYSGGYSDSAALGSHLNLTIEEGTGGSFGDCSGFSASGTVFSGTLAAFDSAHSDYAGGAGTWQPSSTPETRSYRISVELDPATPNSQQGASVSGLTFVWEVST